MTKNECICLFYEIQEKLSSRCPSLIDWRINWLRAGACRCLGKCRPKKKIISMNQEFVEKGRSEDLKDTLLHEFAHAIDWIENGNAGHGKTWKKICLEIGCVPSSKKCSGVQFSNQRQYTYALVHKVTGQVYKHYKRRPTVNLKGQWIRGKKAETLNQLEYRKIS